MTGGAPTIGGLKRLHSYQTGGGGGGGGITSSLVVSSGTNVTVFDLGTAVIMDSSDTDPKTINIPPSAGTLEVIEVMDWIGTAGDFPVTIIPATGAILGLSELNINGMSLTFRDGPLGWYSI